MLFVSDGHWKYFVDVFLCLVVFSALKVCWAKDKSAQGLFRHQFFKHALIATHCSEISEQLGPESVNHQKADGDHPIFRSNFLARADGEQMFERTPCAVSGAPKPCWNNGF